MQWDVRCRWNDQGWGAEMRLEREGAAAPAPVDRRKIPGVSSIETMGAIKGLSRDMTKIDLFVKGFFWKFYEEGMEGSQK